MISKDQYNKINKVKSVTATNEDTIKSAVGAALKDLHTSLPGIIQSFNPATQTASVQPAIQRVFSEKGPLNLPLCVDVPVCFPGGGDFFITFPVKAGDECILIFSERCIDGWAIDGNISEPEDYRQHDLSDAFAIVGVNSVVKKLASFNTLNAEIRNRAGTVKMTISNTGFDFVGNINITGQVVANGHIIDERHKHINSGGTGLGGVVE